MNQRIVENIERHSNYLDRSPEREEHHRVLVDDLQNLQPANFDLVAEVSQGLRYSGGSSSLANPSSSSNATGSSANPAARESNTTTSQLP